MLLTLAAQFVVVFCGAFLAFGLENLRERRRTRRWVARYLRHVFAAFDEQELRRSRQAVADIRDIVETLDKWASGVAPDDIDQRSWRAVMEEANTDVPNFTAMLRGEAINVMPDHVVEELSALQAHGDTLRQSLGRIALAQAEIRPIWFERKAELTAVEVRRVRWAQQMFESTGERAQQTLDRIVTATAAVRSPQAGAAPSSRRR